VKITLVPSAVGVQAEQLLTSFLVNDRIAIDAGALGFHLELRWQADIRHIFITHSHLDHVASLPIFLDNVFQMTQGPVMVYAGEAVQQCLRLDIFNDRVWPNFLEFSVNDHPFVQMVTIQSGRCVQVEGVRITPVAVHHVVPTLGLILEDEGAAVVFSSDTGPTEEIWQLASKTPNLKAVFLEATFPNAMSGLAQISAHLTPAGFMREMKKLPQQVPFLAVHLKAAFRDQVCKELLAYRDPRVEIAKFGTPYQF
jgi:ribonuclease BN (tRNA processing enzyme)